MHAGLGELRGVLDAHVVGHQDVKEAILLGLIAREHVYIEGPPGVAKTMLSEVVSESVSLRYWFYQMHRDVRLNELIGESVIRKESTTEGAEVIKQGIIQGGVLSCEIAVLDDISRAPGQALNVLLRILNERKFADASIPLVTAIATSNPASEDGYYAEPLDPAALDRFTLQLRSHGLVLGKNWKEAEKVIDLFAGPSDGKEQRSVRNVGFSLVHDAGRLAPNVVLSDVVKRKLLRLLQVLCGQYKLTEENSLLTDRTFLAKAVSVLKANAVLNGRFVCQPDDLYVLRYLTTFRVPEDVHAQIEEIITQVLMEEDVPEPIPPPVGGDDGSSDGEESTSDRSPSGEENDSENSARMSDQDEDGQQADSSTSESHAESSPKSESSEGSSSSAAGESIDEEAKDGDSKDVEDENVKGDQRPWGQAGRRGPIEVNNLHALLTQLKGRMEEGWAQEKVCPGGMPRQWVETEHLDNLSDACSVETALWCDNPSPFLPRTHKRTRTSRGGRVAILRDTSASMSGLWNDWATSLSLSLIKMARQRHARVGYVEFSDDVDKFAAGRQRQFFSREYNTLERRASSVRCNGLTNYELPLSLALGEFGALQRHGHALGKVLGKQANNQHILFVTDGQPTSGDRLLTKVIREARELGVSVHTVFIGYSRCPAVLDRLSYQTNGLAYAAYYDMNTGMIEVIDRRRVDMENQLSAPSNNVRLDMQQLNLMSKFPAVFNRFLDQNQSFSR